MSAVGRPGSTFRSLRTRNYRLHVSGFTIATVGTWLQLVAQDWLVLDITGNSGSAIGVTTALQFLPLLLFGLWGGVIADRYPKRFVLMLSQVAMGLLSICLGALTMTGSVRIWHVYALALALGLAQLVANPTRQSFVVELVKPADRANAIALEGAFNASARLVGPAVAGVLINFVGIGPTFLIGGLSYASVILALRLMRESELFSAPRPTEKKGQLRAGLTYVRQRPDVLLILILVAFVAAFGINQQITTALMTKNVFHAGAGSYGLASTAFAVGSLSGSLIAARIARPSKRLMLSTALMFSLVETISALTPTLVSFMALLTVTGLTLVIFTSSSVVTLQLDVAPEMRGRIGGLYYLVFSGTKPLGAPVIGWFSQLLGAPSGLLIGGVVSLITTVSIAPFLLRRQYADVPAAAVKPQSSTR